MQVAPCALHHLGLFVVAVAGTRNFSKGHFLYSMQASVLHSSVQAHLDRGNGEVVIDMVYRPLANEYQSSIKIFSFHKDPPLNSLPTSE